MEDYDRDFAYEVGRRLATMTPQERETWSHAPAKETTLQERIILLEDLLKHYYAAAKIGDSMVNPTQVEECEYAEQMRHLMEDTEYLLPELKQDVPEDDVEEYQPDASQEYGAWAAWARTVS